MGVGVRAWGEAHIHKLIMAALLVEACLMQPFKQARHEVEDFLFVL